MPNGLLLSCQVTTERMIRQQLQDQTGVDMSDRKAFIKQQVTRRGRTTLGLMLVCTNSLPAVNKDPFETSVGSVVERVQGVAVR